MKTNTLKAAAAVGLSALLIGSAAAQDESVSKPVGYETINIDQAFNYIGLRLVGAPLATSTVATTDEGAGQMTLDNATLEDGTVIVEVNDGDAIGAVVEATVAAGVVSVPASILGDLVVGDSVTVRAPQTLESIFGDPVDGAADSTLGLNGGNSASADLVLVPDGANGFTTYFYDNGGFGGVGAGWKQLDVSDNTSVVVPDPSAVTLIYTDGIVVQNRGDNNSVVVSGSVKTTATSPALTATFNYLSTVYPAGATLSTLFDDPANPGTLRQGGTINGGNSASADLILVPDGAAFKTYFYSNGGFNGVGAGWKELDVSDNTNKDIVSADISLDDKSSIIIENRGEVQNAEITPPSFYSTL